MSSSSDGWSFTSVCSSANACLDRWQESYHGSYATDAAILRDFQSLRTKRRWLSCEKRATLRLRSCSGRIRRSCSVFAQIAPSKYESLPQLHYWQICVMRHSNLWLSFNWRRAGSEPGRFARQQALSCWRISCSSSNSWHRSWPWRWMCSMRSMGSHQSRCYRHGHEVLIVQLPDYQGEQRMPDFGLCVFDSYIWRLEQFEAQQFLGHLKLWKESSYKEFDAMFDSHLTWHLILAC